MDLSENIIKKVHFIWIGSPFNDSRIIRNLRNWILSQTEKIEMFLWYDSHFLTSKEIDMMVDASKIVNLDCSQNLIFVDVRECLLVETRKRKRGQQMRYKPHKDLINEYEYESGLKGRPETGKLLSFIRNWGYATDILRTIILLNHGGFYFDVDMNPIDINSYRKDFDIKTCPSGFGISVNDSKTISLSYPLDHNKFYTIITNALYLDINNPEGVSLAEKYAKNIRDNSKIIRKNEYWYLLLSYISSTIYTTGSMAIPRTFTLEGSPRDLLLGLKENEELGVIHTWFLTPYQMARMYDLVSDNIYAIYSIRYQKRYQSSYIITVDYVKELEKVLLFLSNSIYSELEFIPKSQRKIEKYIKELFGYDDKNMIEFIANVIDDAIYELDELELIKNRDIYDCICNDFNYKMPSGFELFASQYIQDYVKYFPDKSKSGLFDSEYIINSFKGFYQHKNVEYNWKNREKCNFEWYFNFFIKMVGCLYNFQKIIISSELVKHQIAMEILNQKIIPLIDNLEDDDQIISVANSLNPTAVIHLKNKLFTQLAKDYLLAFNKEFEKI
jgi:hypothetical protein